MTSQLSTQLNISLVTYSSICCWKPNLHSSFKFNLLFCSNSRGDLSPNSSYPESSANKPGKTSNRKKGMGQAKGPVPWGGRAIKARSW